MGQRLVGRRHWLHTAASGPLEERIHIVLRISGCNVSSSTLQICIQDDCWKKGWAPRHWYHLYFRNIKPNLHIQCAASPLAADKESAFMPLQAHNGLALPLSQPVSLCGDVDVIPVPSDAPLYTLAAGSGNDMSHGHRCCSHCFSVIAVEEHHT